jgi:hypothetical protein
MANSISMPVPAQRLRFVAESQSSRESKVWEDGKAYGDRATKKDAKGRALQQFSALVDLSGTRLGVITVESPTPLPEDMPLGVVFQGAGTAVLTIGNNRQGLDLNTRLALEGFEAPKC